MGIITMMATGEDPLEPRATLLLLLMMRTVDTAPEAEADPVGRAAGIETLTTKEEPEQGSRSSSKDGAA